MLTRRLMTSVCVGGMIGLAACADEGVDDDAMIMEDTIMQPDTQQVRVPVETTDTSLIRTEIDIDTAIDVDTIDDPPR